MGSKSQTSTSSSSSAPTNLAGVQSIFNAVQGAASTPYQAYNGELTAGINGQQTQGINNINANAGYANPFIQQASGLVQNASNPLTASQIQNYQNPYTQQVVDATQAQFNKSNAEGQNSLKGNAAIAGALGGDRQAVAQSQLAGQQATAQAPVIANLYSQGYNNAVNTATNQYQQNPLAQANALANYGVQGQNAALTGAGAQVGAGTLQQQTQQAQDTANYGQFQNQQAYPFQTAAYLQQYGLPAALAQGSSSNGTQTTPGPNPWSQALGLGTAALTAFSDERVKENIEKVGATHDGQPIYRFNYKGSPMTQIGLMAQDVEKSHPDAVGESNGIKTVDYARATDDAAGGFATGGGVDGYVNRTPFWQSAHGYVPMGGSPSNAALQAPQLQFAKQSQDGSGDIGKMLGTAGKAFGKGSSTPDYGQDSNINVGGYSMPQFGNSVDVGGYRMPTIGFKDGGFIEAVNHIRSSIKRARGGTVNSSPLAAYADGGDATFDDRFSAAFPRQDDVINPDTPFRMPDREAVDAWRKDVNNPAIVADSGGKPPATPMAAPMQASLPKQITNPDNDPEEDPSTALAYDRTRPAGNPMSLAPPAAQPQEATPEGRFGSFNPLGLSDKAREAIITGALGAAASRSPFIGTAIAEGGLHGMGAYSSATKAEQEAANNAATKAQNQQRIDMEAKRLSQSAEQFTKNYGLKKQELEQGYQPKYGVVGQEIDPDTGTPRNVYGWIDPNTKQVTRDTSTPAAGKPAPLLNEKGELITGDEYLKSLSPQRAEIARKIGNYEINPSGLSIKGGRREQAIADAARYNPGYDQRNFNSSNAAIKNFNAGPESRTVRSLNVAIDHLGTLDEAAKALQNGDYPTLNKIVNIVKEKTGSPVTTNFDSIKQVVSAEIAKAVVGGQTALHDRDDMAKRAANSQSPEQISGIITEFKKLMAGQMKGLRHSYEATTGLKDFEKYLEPQTKKELEAVMPKESKAAPASSAPALPAAPAGVPPGSAYSPSRKQWRAPDGKIYNADGSKA
jgi:hypothetical protein